jgi:hypothetical protein
MHYIPYHFDFSTNPNHDQPPQTSTYQSLVKMVQTASSAPQNSSAFVEINFILEIGDK